MCLQIWVYSINLLSLALERKEGISPRLASIEDFCPPLPLAPALCTHPTQWYHTLWSTMKVSNRKDTFLLKA